MDIGTLAVAGRESGATKVISPLQIAHLPNTIGMRLRELRLALFFQLFAANFTEHDISILFRIVEHTLGVTKLQDETLISEIMCA